MSWIRKSPFSRDEDVTTRMVSLLSEEVDRYGTPLSDAEREILSSETVSPGEELRQRVLKLIGQILEREQGAASKEDLKSFRACLEWVEPDYPNIAALAEEVVTSSGFGTVPPLHGRRWVKDRTQLIGCGLLVVLSMDWVVAVWSLIANRK